MFRHQRYAFGVLMAVLLSIPVATSAADAPSAEYLNMVAKLLADSDVEFRGAALEQVRTAGGGTPTTLRFVAELDKLGPAAKAALVRALADRGDAAARTAVVALANSTDDDVRVASLKALGRLGNSADLPVLFQALAASDAERAAARSSLTQLIGPEITKSVADQATSAPTAVKAALIEVLATRRALDQMPAFIAATLDEQPQVRMAAMTALSQVGDAKQLAAMLPGVLKAAKGGERDAAEKCVVAVCTRINNENERADALIAALNTMDAAQRDQLLSLVGRVGGKKLIQFVVDIANSEATPRRALAIDALSKWPDASVADKLLELANKAAEPAERTQAFQGFVKVSATRDKRTDRQRLDRMKQAIQAAQTLDERTLVLNRCRTAYDVETLRFLLPYVDQSELAQTACESIVELAHHREVRDPNKAEFDVALDRVAQISKDPVVVDRAGRYKRGETWTRPTK